MADSPARRVQSLLNHLDKGEPACEGGAPKACAGSACGDVEDIDAGCKRCGSRETCGGKGKAKVALGEEDENLEHPLGSGISFSTPGLPLRAKSRLAGPSGNYWYPAELEQNMKPGDIKAVVFWKTWIALFKTMSGEIYALEDRCAHRQLRLSKGHVEGERLACCYHGWEYDGNGRVVKVAHEIPKSFKTLPKIEIRTYPLRIKYGIIWVFPGDPAKADVVPLPKIPWLDKDPPTPFKFVDVTVKAHFSIIIENNCDFYHAYLHRKFKPFVWPELQSVERNGDAIHVNYRTDMESSSGARMLGKTDGRPLTDMNLWYDYPYQRSNLVDKYLHWFFCLPINEHETRTFYVFLWEYMELGPLSLPYSLRAPVLWGIHKFYLVPVLRQDLYALEEENEANFYHATKPAVELNPLVSAFQRMTVEKWEEYLASEKARAKAMPKREWRLQHGAGLSDWRWAME